jgi:hypothetical protein
LFDLCRAHLEDDNDASICATIFNSNTTTIITPVNNTAMYNMLIKPKYPVDVQYVVDGERKMPIPAGAMAKLSAYSAEPTVETTYPGKEAKTETTTVVHHVMDEAVECKVAQVIWGKISISTQVNGKTLKYDGTLYAVPDFNSDSTMTMPMRRMGSVADNTKVIQAMCGDKAVKEVVPWIWEFDLKRA